MSALQFPRRQALDGRLLLSGGSEGESSIGIASARLLKVNTWRHPAKQKWLQTQRYAREPRSSTSLVTRRFCAPSLYAAHDPLLPQGLIRLIVPLAGSATRACCAAAWSPRSIPPSIAVSDKLVCAECSLFQPGTSDIKLTPSSLDRSIDDQNGESLDWKAGVAGLQ